MHHPISSLYTGTSELLKMLLDVANALKAPLSEGERCEIRLLRRHRPVLVIGVRPYRLGIVVEAVGACWRSR